MHVENDKYNYRLFFLNERDLSNSNQTGAAAALARMVCNHLENQPVRAAMVRFIESDIELTHSRDNRTV